MIADDLSRALVTFATEKLADHSAQVKRCAALLTDAQLWYRPNESSNSVGNLLLHLRGNIAQWILGGIGGRPFARDRAAEFARREPIARQELVGPLSEAVEEAGRIIQALDAAALVREYGIQQYRVTGLAAVLHVLEHFAFHTGQIVTTTKWLLDVDLSLYDVEGHRRDRRDTGAP